MASRLVATLFVALAVSSVPGDAARSGLPLLPQRRFVRWNADNGLPAGQVYDLARTPRGYLWIATLGGLVRYDGARFTVFNRDTTDAIEGRTTVTCRVVEDGLETLVLDLAQPKPPPADRGMTVGSVTEAGKALSFEHAGDRLTIRLAPAGRARDVRRIDVAYRGVPATGLLIAPTKHGERSFFSDNWPIKARQWLPTLDQFIGALGG